MGSTDARPAASTPGPAPTGLDEIDRSIVEAMTANARIPYADLARLVGLSPPSVTERVKRLEARGVITGYRAVVSPVALGFGVVALVGIEQSDDGDQDAVATMLYDVPEVEDCWLVAGDETFVVKVRVADVNALETTLGKLRRIPGIGRTHTTVVLSTRWESRPRGRMSS